MPAKAKEACPACGASLRIFMRSAMYTIVSCVKCDYIETRKNPIPRNDKFDGPQISPIKKKS